MNDTKYRIEDEEAYYGSSGQSAFEMKETKPAAITSISTPTNADAGQVETVHGEVKRQLKPRHVSMIALGGTIGTGLFIGTGSALRDAGPVGMLIAYVFMATIVYSLAQSIGEMATFIPITGSFTVFCTRFVSPAFGAAVGWMYWFSWAITFAIELSIVGQVIQFWTDAVPLAAWIGIFYVILTGLNLFPVKIYGEIEFWMASVKVIAIVGWLIYAFCMVCGAGVTGPVGFRYWRNPGPWGPGILVENIHTARFLGWMSSLVNAAFTFQGTELVGVAAGESQNPRKTVPKAINRVFLRIIIFYICSVIFMGLLVPYNDPALVDESTFISSSPFVIAIVNSGTKILPHIFNAVILATIISAGNSNVYIGSRLLYALGSTRVGFRFMTYTTPSGVPWVGVLITSLIGLLGFLSVSNGSSTAFDWLVNISAVAGLVSWAAISLSNIRFVAALKYQGISRDSLPFKAMGGTGYMWYALISITIIVIIQGFTSFWDFNASDFFTAYISLFIFIGFWIVFQFVIFRGPLLLPPSEIDIDTGRREDLLALEPEFVPGNWWEKILDFLF